MIKLINFIIFNTCSIGIILENRMIKSLSYLFPDSSDKYILKSILISKKWLILKFRDKVVNF